MPIVIPDRNGKMNAYQKTLNTMVNYGAIFDNELTPGLRRKEPLKVPNYSMFVVGLSIKKVIFHGPATIVIWDDNTKTVVKCMEGDEFDPEKGLAMAISKRIFGDDFHATFKRYLKEAQK